MRWLERRIILDVVDSQWKDHLLSLDHLKEGIGLRGYAQKDPIVEFKKEAFVLFEDMMARIDNETIRYLFHIQIQQARAASRRNADASGCAGAWWPAGQVRRSGASSLARPLRASGGAAAAVVASAAAAPVNRWRRSACPTSLANSIANSSASNRTCNIKPAPPKPNRRNQSAPPQKSAATIPAPAAPAKNTKNATAKARYAYQIIPSASNHLRRCCG